MHGKLKHCIIKSQRHKRGPARLCSTSSASAAASAAAKVAYAAAAVNNGATANVNTECFCKTGWPQQLITFYQQDLQHDVGRPVLKMTNQTEPTCMANQCCALVLRSGNLSEQHVCPAAIAQLHNGFVVIYRRAEILGTSGLRTVPVIPQALGCKHRSLTDCSILRGLRPEACRQTLSWR